MALSVLIERGLKGDDVPREEVLQLRRQGLAFADIELDGQFEVEEEIVFLAVR